jgi:HPt (histidine-containing phosphotransfer) domain-containing protein
MSDNKIPGINMDAGLDLYGGDMDIYLSALRSFSRNALQVIDKLRNVSQESLHDYDINVHGLKSISASIGAEKIQEKAYNLEMMAKANDLAGILSGNQEFCKDVENLVKDIQVWLKDNDN